jgi:hypothetical protein
MSSSEKIQRREKERSLLGKVIEKWEANGCQLQADIAKESLARMQLRHPGSPPGPKQPLTSNLELKAAVNRKTSKLEYIESRDSEGNLLLRMTSWALSPKAAEDVLREDCALYSEDEEVREEAKEEFKARREQELNSRTHLDEREAEAIGAKKGGDSRSAPMAERLKAAADAWWKRDPTMSVREVADRLAKGEKATGASVSPGLFGGFEKIRKAIKKPTPG